jgi:hypothetical protein
VGPYVHFFIGPKKEEHVISKALLDFYSIKYEWINGVDTINLPSYDLNELKQLHEWMLEGDTTYKILHPEVTPDGVFHASFNFIRLAADLGIPRAGVCKMGLIRKLLVARNHLLQPKHVRLIFKVYPMGHPFRELMAEAAFDDYTEDCRGVKFRNEFNDIKSFKLLVHATAMRSILHMTLLHPLTQRTVVRQPIPLDSMLSDWPSNESDEPLNTS